MTIRETDTYTELLRSHGLRATPQRILVMELLANTERPMSISQLQKNALTKSAHTALDMVTLYRSLETLVGKSLVRPVDLRHGHVDYELVREGKHHHHLVCEKCGAVEDFTWCPNEKLQKNILENTKNFATLTDHSLEFFGVCKKCS